MHNHYLTTGGQRARDMAGVRMRPDFWSAVASAGGPLDAPEVMPAGAHDSTSTRRGGRPCAAQSEVRRDWSDLYPRALADALPMLDCGIRSALKQAASDCGIPWGAPMGEFVEWAEARLMES